MNENLSSFRAAAIMMQTGPVVTLHVAKSGASYHGLEALMTPPAPENTSSKTQMWHKSWNMWLRLRLRTWTLSDGRDAAPERGQASVIYCAVEAGGRMTGQTMQRNGQLHRSSPNVSGQAAPPVCQTPEMLRETLRWDTFVPAGFYLEDGREPTNPDVQEKTSASRTGARTDVSFGLLRQKLRRKQNFLQLWAMKRQQQLEAWMGSSRWLVSVLGLNSISGSETFHPRV